MLTACPPPEVLYGMEALDNDAPGQSVPHVPSGHAAKPIGDGQLLRLSQAAHTRPGPAPDTLVNGPHVTFSGTIQCHTCIEPLLFSVIRLDSTGSSPRLGSLAGGSGRVPLVTARVSAGPFSVIVPQVKVPVAIELLVDTNNDGVPSVGERYVQVLDPKNPLRTDLDRTGLLLDASDRPIGRDSNRP